MISNPSDIQKHLIFKALVRAIETNSGLGFHNNDQGHLAYASGAQGQENLGTWGDSSEQNELFKLLASFDREFHEEDPDLSTWQKFCAFAVGSYNRVRSQAR